MEATLVEQPSFEETFLIGVRAEDVWAALTMPDSINRWHLCNVIAFDPRPGGRIQLGSAGEVVIDGTVTDFEPNQRLGYTFHFTSEPDEPPTEVVFSLEPINTNCQLTISHKGFTGYSSSYRDICACWPILMCGLREMLKPSRRDRAPRAA